MPSERKIVALTPVKNEAWILPLFCQSASIWADYIVIADQGSTDGSREIASKYPKVVLIDNTSTSLDEGFRDRILLEKARELVGSNGILVRVDADEIFTPNFESVEWTRIRQSPSGAIWYFRWLQINKDFKSYWENKPTYGAFVDDGRDFTAHGLIHVRDMFSSDNPDDIVVTKEIGLLHFQFVDWNRMRSKHRWYQCYERINFPNKSAVDIYRIYHWMYNPSLPFREIPLEWMKEYRNKYHVDLNGYVREKHYWRDDEVNDWLIEYTPRYFRHIETYMSISELIHAEGKNFGDKLLLMYLHYTRRMHNKRRGVLYKVTCRVDSFLKTKLKL